MSGSVREQARVSTDGRGSKRENRQENDKNRIILKSIWKNSKGRISSIISITATIDREHSVITRDSYNQVVDFPRVHGKKNQ